MIHINFPNGRKPPAKWLRKAKTLTKLLEKTLDKAARNKIIEDNSSFWGEIKEWLEEFSHGKCWFSEARDTCSYWHVEHFRPKKAAKEPDRDGYWWLAFNYLNYRLCGGVVNTKKGAYFPLKPGTSPASCPIDNCDDEACTLIDPIRKDDVDLITFSNGGIAVPAESDGWRCERADKSIKRYKLNDHPPLNRARKIVWNLCRTHVIELENLILLRKRSEESGSHSPSRNERIENLKLELRNMTLPNAEFSAVARAFLLQDRRKWVRRLIA